MRQWENARWVMSQQKRSTVCQLWMLPSSCVCELKAHVSLYIMVHCVACSKVHRFRCVFPVWRSHGVCYSFCVCVIFFFDNKVETVNAVLSTGRGLQKAVSQKIKGCSCATNLWYSGRCVKRQHFQWSLHDQTRGWRQKYIKTVFFSPQNLPRKIFPPMKTLLKRLIGLLCTDL